MVHNIMQGNIIVNYFNSKKGRPTKFVNRPYRDLSPPGGRILQLVRLRKSGKLIFPQQIDIGSPLEVFVFHMKRMEHSMHNWRKKDPHDCNKHEPTKEGIYGCKDFCCGSGQWIYFTHTAQD